MDLISIKMAMGLDVRFRDYRIVHNRLNRYERAALKRFKDD